jgi:hypothetical protein
VTTSTAGVSRDMPDRIIVWDLETIPDLKGFAAANGHDGKTDDEIRAMGDKFRNTFITRSYASAR